MSSNPNLNKDLGGKLREIRQQQQLTRERLAEKIDVSSRFLADVESGKVGISLLTLKRICTVLGVSADYLLGIEDRKDEYSEIVNRLNRLNSNQIEHIKSMIRIFCEALEEM